MAFGRRLLLPALAGCALALAPRAASAQSGVSLELRVQRAIEHGVAWLVKEQQPDGRWPGNENDHPGGETALAALTLVKSGLERDDPHLRDALAALRKVEWKSTYSASVYLMLLAALVDKSHTSVAGEGRPAFDLLLANQREGLWPYPWGGADMSNTQFALLGLRAGAQLGFEVPDKLLEQAIPALFRLQRPDGGFPYDLGRESTGSMTAATLGGLCALAELGRRDERVVALLVRHRADLARAESWMEARFRTGANPYGERYETTGWHYAYLWAIERWCGLAQRTKLGTHDWYREGAAWLVDEQQAGGSWGYAGSSERLNTCFALLFLRRATISAPFELGEMWKQIEREKAAQSARPRISPAGEIRFESDWLYCGPLHDKPGLPQFLDPSALHLDKLHARERVKLAGGDFERVTLKSDDWTNLDELTKREMEPGEGVLAAVLVWEPGKDAPEPALDVLFWPRFEDGIKVWLDGKPVVESLRMQSAIEDCMHVDLSLAPGVHELVVLIGDVGGAAAFGARFSDAQGKALPAGFRCVAEPPRARKR
ncbi:MAG: terpene cyclase/mutase family protein [Planctomycetes bacterium]|nr:terpene cyclase/mutase family protein [Planctomycetota bacterium]